jgi:hypothetical protein
LCSFVACLPSGISVNKVNCTERLCRPWLDITLMHNAWFARVCFLVDMAVCQFEWATRTLFILKGTRAYTVLVRPLALAVLLSTYLKRT